VHAARALTHHADGGPVEQRVERLERFARALVRQGDLVQEHDSQRVGGRVFVAHFAGAATGVARRVIVDSVLVRDR
jgi:hypothetical protein